MRCPQIIRTSEVRAGTGWAADSIPTHMNALLSAGIGAVFSAVIVFLTSWEGDRRKRSEEERRAIADDRAALEAMANEFVAAVLAVRVEGNAHDHLWGGWKARTVVAVHAAVHGGAAYFASDAGAGERERRAGLLAALRAASGVISRWDRESAVSAVRLSAPLTRLGAAVAPLLHRPEPGLAQAAQETFDAVVAYTDADRTERALAAFHQALTAIPAPAAPRRRFLRRRARRTTEDPA